MGKQTFEETKAIRRLLSTEWGRTHLYFGVVKSQKDETNNQPAKEEHGNEQSA